jgi:hypothetical protein
MLAGLEELGPLLCFRSVEIQAIAEDVEEARLV